MVRIFSIPALIQWVIEPGILALFKGLLQARSLGLKSIQVKEIWPFIASVTVRCLTISRGFHAALSCNGLVSIYWLLACIFVYLVGFSP